MAYPEDVLDAIQDALAIRLAGLRETRAGAPVYALEHGLDSEQLVDVQDAVGAAVRRVGVGRWWRERSLPLLIVATEAGYRYRGTGTDFWPVLSGAIAAELSFTDHVRLSELFSAAHLELGLKKPADTPWNRLFRHIAWPISNAIAPLEIHRALAQALHRVFQDPPASLEEAYLAGALQAAARAGSSPRLREWVEDPGLSVALSRRLMRLDNDGSISPDAVERIWRDLSADTVARRALSQAMQEQRSSTRATKGVATGAVQAVLQLLSPDGGTPRLSLAAASPSPSDAQRRLVRGLSLRPWEGASPIGLEAFLLGHPQLLTFTDLPQGASEFLPGLEELVADVDLQARLRSAAPDLTRPLVFAGSHEIARQVRDRTVAANERAWVVMKEPGPGLPQSVVSNGVLGGAVCLSIAEPARAADWLGRHGIVVREMARLEAVDAVVVAQTPRGPVMGFNMPELFRLTGGGAEPVNVSAGPDPGVALSSSRPYLLAKAGAGEHQLTVSSLGRSTVLAWSVETVDRYGEAPFEITLDPPAPSLEMFRRGEVAVHIRTALSLDPGPLTASIMAGDQIVARSRAFGVRLPALLTASDGVLGELVNALADADLPHTGDAHLVIQVHGLCREWWPLGREARRVVWERHDNDWKPLLDLKLLPSGAIDADRPLDAVRVDPPAVDEAIRLLLPVEAGGPLDDCGFVVGPRRLTIGANPVLPPGLLRTWTSAGGGDVHSTTLNYLRWSWAEARNPVLEVGRRQVVATLEAATVSQFCGENWSGLEQHYRGGASDRWTALAEASVARGLAVGAGFPDLDGWKHGALVRHLSQRMSQTGAEIWSGVPQEVESAAERLDLAVGEAWEDLFGEVLRREGRFVLEDVDPGNTDAAWAEAASLARDRLNFGSMLELVLPRSRSAALGQPDYQDLSLDEVWRILIASHTDLNPRGQPRWLTDEDIRRGLMFWALPGALSSDPDWAQSLQRLLADRQTARAIRYGALRYSASRGRRS